MTYSAWFSTTRGIVTGRMRFSGNVELVNIISLIIQEGINYFHASQCNFRHDRGSGQSHQSK